MKLKGTILLLAFITVLNGFLFGQLSSSATYTAGNIAVDAGFQIPSQSSTCPGSLTVTIPLGAAVTGVDVVYDFEAVAGSGAYKSYQLSELRCVSSGGLNEGVLASFPNDWTTGVLTYERLGLTIADGVLGGGDIMFELHAGTTQYGQTGCSTEKMRINDGTWTVTVHYLDPSYPSPPLNPNPVDGAEAVSINVGSLSWDFGENTEEYDLYFGTTNPPTVKVVDNEASGVSGSYTLETLNGSSNYYWQLVVRNSAKNELAGPVWSFSTECLPTSIPIFTDFDDLDVPQWGNPHFINPTCWTLLYECAEGYANQGAYLSTEAFSPPNCWMMTNEGDGNAWSMMIMPEMLDNLNTLQLSFLVKINYSIHPLSIGTMSDPNDAETYTEFTTINPPANQYTEVEIPFSAYTGTDKYLAVRYEALNPNTWDYTYIDNVLISEVPTCPKPKELGVLEVSPTTANVFWTEQGSATQWNIEYVLAGATPSGTPNISATENPYTITGLEPATQYDFYVQSDCGGGDLSYWSSQGDILTACLPTEAPLFENFDASTALPACWSTATAGNGGWQMQTYSSYSAPNNIRLATSSAGDVSMLVSPPLSVTDGSIADVQLNFFAKRTAIVNNLIVGTISNPLDYTTFSPITTVELPTSNAWTECEVWFNNYSGDDIYIAIKVGDLTNSSSINIDDINIGLLPYCLNPIDLWVNDINETDARLNFTESREATMWHIEIGPVGFEPGTGAETLAYTYELAGDDYSYVMTGLESGTFYDVYMYADCGGGDNSLWSPMARFMSQLELFSPLPFAETFDPDFTYTGNPPTNNLDWTLSTTLFHSEPNSAYNHYAGVSNNVLLVTKRFDLSDRANVYLSFWHIAKTDGDRDHCYVEISSDGGATFEAFPVSAYFGLGNYRLPTMNTPEGPCFDEDSYTDWGTTNTTPTNTWWKNETFDLSGYSGSDNVVIRFRLTGDAYTNRYGWLIDDITVETYAGTEMMVNPAAIDVEVEPLASATETLTVSNNGDFPITFTATVKDYSKAMTTLLSQDFEAGVPEDWTILNEGTSNGSMWKWSDPAITGYNLNDTYYMMVNRSYPDTASESLITPSFDGTGYTNIFLSLDKVWAKGSSSAPDFAEISVWDGAAWQSIEYMKTVNVGAWGAPSQTVYDITAFANPDMQVKFYYYGMSYSRNAIDNVVITASDIPVNWLTLDGGTSVTGLVQGGESQDIEVGFTTKSTFPLDKWYSSIEVTSNDLVNSPAVVPVSMSIGCFQPWEYTQTGQVHNISIPLEVAPSIFGEPLEANDWIGIFYLDDNGEEACGGAIQWNGVNGVVINAYGDDATTLEKDGFAAGEAFGWRMKKCGSQDQYSAAASYDTQMPNQGNFADFGLSKLIALNAAYFQNYSFNQGWNSMSSYVVPSDPAVENMFAPVVNELTILRNLTSLYWPAEGTNTIGNWDNYSGYVIKVTDAFDFEISGEAMVSGEFTIPAGWSYFPVLSPCQADVMEMFTSNLDDVIIIQELIGVKVFWPSQQIYTLETFEPGKAYIVKLANEITVSFPVCSAKANVKASSQNNTIETAWGTVNMSPVSQVALFMQEAIDNFVDGDVIGAFDQDGHIYGYLPVNGKCKNLAMTLFGDDNTSATANGFTNDEAISYKLLRTATGEEFDLEVVYSPAFENTSGNFVSGSFSAISDLKLSPTGIEGLNNSGVGIYPNPASEMMNITGIAGDAQIRIFNVFGEEVFKSNISATTAVNVSSLSKGTYVVKIIDSRGETMNKLVIK